MNLELRDRPPHYVDPAPFDPGRTEPVGAESSAHREHRHEHQDEPGQELVLALEGGEQDRPDGRQAQHLRDRPPHYVDPAPFDPGRTEPVGAESSAVDRASSWRLTKGAGST
jgi:hypothetical protein